MKYDSSDILTFLRLFNLADDQTMPRQIERIEKSKPHEKNVLIRFTFNKKKYAMLIDSAAEDDVPYIMEQVVEQGIPHEYQLLENPNGDGFLTYAMPWRGKEGYLLVDTKDAGTRLDVAMVERFGEKSRSTYQKLIKRGEVKLNGVVQTSPKRLVTPTDEITLEEIAPERTTLQYDVIFEDENVLVINKPAGMLTHAKGAIAEEFTAADIIKPKTSYKADTNRPGIVHRLDRDTSGVLLMVKNDETASMVQRQFTNRSVKKEYTAVVSGRPAQDEALIDVPIERNPSAPSTFRPGVKGKEAQTAYSVRDENAAHTLLQLRPKTGRTHQLRVHTQHIGVPILGDRVYGTEEADRMYLHASRLELTLPGGVRKVFEAPLPVSFQEQLA